MKVRKLARLHDYKKLAEEKENDKITHVNLRADSCGGKNRNIKVVLMLNHLLYTFPNLNSISLKFLVSGHSFLPNDTNFAFIEFALKKLVRLYTAVDDYILVMKTCNNKKYLIIIPLKSMSHNWFIKNY